MRTICVSAMVIMLVMNATECFGLSLIKNGSFEDDAGGIVNIQNKAPQFWDVNVPSKFGGGVSAYWKQNGKYTLDVFANGGTFTAGEKAFVSQQVDLSDANEIIFDVKLLSFKYGQENAWDPTKCTAFMQIDNDVVWESNSIANGAYYNVSVDVNSSYKDAMPHKLSLGIRIKTSGSLSVPYWTVWDFVKFDTYCGGLGYLACDFNHDCYVDMADFVFLANDWLATDIPASESRIDLAFDGTINLTDFAMLAQQWMQCTDWADTACKPVPIDMTYDFNEDGIVNFADYAMLPADANTADISDFADRWLQKSWLYGLKSNAEDNGGGLPQ